MSRNGSGQMNLPAGNPVVSGTIIDPAAFNSTMSDIANELTNSIPRDGQAPPTNNLPMGGYRHTNVANAQNRNEYATVAQVQDAAVLTLSGVTGTDTITATINPPITAYAAGQKCKGVMAGTNTTTSPTLNINSLGAVSIVMPGGGAPAIGAIPANGAEFFHNGTNFVLMNPVIAAGTIGTTQLADASVTAGKLASGVAVANLGYTPVNKAGDNLTGPVNANRGTALPSAATVAIGAATGEFVHITGTTTITAFDTVQAGTEREVVFDGVLTLTYNATSLILPTAANITTAAGDTAKFRSEGGGNWKCVSYTRASGQALSASTPLNSGIRLNTPNGCGSGTRFRRFTNVVSNTGSDITYVDSAANGASFTVVNPGVYSVSYSDSNTSAQTIAITLNDSQGGNAVASTTPANVLASCTCISSGYAACTSWTGFLPAGSVITPKTDGNGNGASSEVQFSMYRLS